MPLIADVQQDAGRARILDAARRCFDRGGLNKPGLAAIARRL